MTMQTHYWLAPLVYGCRTREGTVLLDVANNKYVGLDHSNSVALAHSVVDWPLDPMSTGETSSSSSSIDAQAVADALLNSALLTTTRPEVRRITSVPISLYRDLAAVGEEIDLRTRVTVNHVVQFATAFLSASFALRWHKFESVVETVSRRNSRNQPGATPFDIERAASLVNVFRQIRPYVFAAKGRCLLHALTLVNFLAYYGVYVNWVIAVKTNPWGAHSWAQRDNLLFDCSPEKVCDFAPILAV